MFKNPITTNLAYPTALKPLLLLFSVTPQLFLLHSQYTLSHTWSINAHFVTYSHTHCHTPPPSLACCCTQTHFYPTFSCIYPTVTHSQPLAHAHCVPPRLARPILAYICLEWPQFLHRPPVFPTGHGGSLQLPAVRDSDWVDRQTLHSGLQD